MKFRVFLLLTFMVLASCNTHEEDTVDALAEDYVRLVLAVGQYDGDVVDAYFGPEAWRPVPLAPSDTVFPIDDFASRVEEVKSRLETFRTDARINEARGEMFAKQIRALEVKIEMIGGVVYPFDQEARYLFDAEPPHHSKVHFDELLQQLDLLLPGEGTVSDRYSAYASQFVIPKNRLDTVFQVAIAEARRRTIEWLSLPKDESFVLEYVTDKSWSGYNYFQGGHQSLIQINTDFPIFIERAIDLACHEGYPGHHVYNTLLEQNLVESNGWKEFTVYPLFSPQSLIAEGSANFGISVAFPGAERLRYEQEVLFPLAGIDPALAPDYYEVQALRHELNYANNEAARLYLAGTIDRDSAAQWLETYLLYEPDRAQQRTRFIDQYRAYVINYNLGQDLVSQWVQAEGGSEDQPSKRWEVFGRLLSNPFTASKLK